MIPTNKIPPPLLQKIFENDLLKKKLEIMGAVWQVKSVNPKKHTISLELLGIFTPKETSTEPSTDKPT